MIRLATIEVTKDGRHERLFVNWRNIARMNATFLKKAASATLAILSGAVLVFAQTGPAFAVVQSPAPAAKVSFTFDDGLASAITKAAPTLATYGLSGTNYVTTGCIGMTTVPNDCAADGDHPYMSWAQVSQLKNTYGWEIGAHSATHPQLATDNLTEAQLVAEVGGSKQALADHGFNAIDFASPFGDYSNTTLAVIAKYFASHRGFHDVDNNVWSYNDYLLNNMQVQVGVTVAQVKARIDQAIANNHWLVLTFHDIADVPSNDPQDYQYKTSDLAQIAAYVKAKQDANLIKQVNIDEGLVKSTVNLLPNASFDNGISGGWSASGPGVSADSGNNGNYPSATHSAKFVAGTSNGHLFTPKVTVDSAQTYMIKSFLNLKTITTGELGYYIDEYDAAGNWISGKWIQAKGAAIVQNVNFTYSPTSANVKKASLQIYVTANSGITAYIDNVEWFNLAGTDTPPPPAPTNNLLPNSDFAHGIADGWRTDNVSAFTPDSANQGAPTSPANAIKLTAQTGNTHLFAPVVSVNGTSEYTINAYANITALTGGELGFYIDEYDAAGNWISGKYAFAKRNAGAETVAFTYSPSSTAVAKSGLQVILTGGSGIAGYLDEVKFLAPEEEVPPTPPAEPTNLVTNGTFDAGLSGGWTTNDPANIVADTSNNGAPANPLNSIKLTASAQNRHLFSPQVTVSSNHSYSLASYLKLQLITSGEVGFYIDEYDAAGNWISGQYKTGISAISAADVTMTYTPSSAAVAKASLQVIVVGSSGIVAFVDNVRWYQN